MMSSLAIKNLFSRVARGVSRIGHSCPSSFTFHHSPFTSRRGFTLIEILVASLLLGMLMTVLTMVFNSSAIAWRTGRASNAEMSLVRRQLAYVQYQADNALPRIDKDGKTGRILGAWSFEGNSQKVRERAVEDNFNAKGFTLPGWSSDGSVGSGIPPSWVEVTDFRQIQNQGGQSYFVGVRSLGPDGQKNFACCVSRVRDWA